MSVFYIHAPVAQLDRVLGYEPRGREFESLRARHTLNLTIIYSGKIMTDEYENFINSERNKKDTSIKQLSDYKTLHDLKKEVSSYVDWFNTRSIQSKLNFSYKFKSEQSEPICIIKNKSYDYEEIELTAYESSSSNSWHISSSFIKGSPKDEFSKNLYSLDEVNSLKEFIECIRNLLMDILIDEKIGLRN